MYNKAQQREIALSAVRGEIRSAQHRDPSKVSAQDALLILDDIARRDPDLIAAMWYLAASETQLRAFVRDWRRHW